MQLSDQNKHSVILRSPRLAIVGADPRTVGVVVDGLAGYMSAWDITTHVYVSTAAPAAASPSGSRRTWRPLSELTAHSWRPVSAAEAANGGDLTLLVLSAAPDLADVSAADIEFVRVTSTPVVIATTPDEHGKLDVGSLPYAVGGLVIARSGSLSYEPIAGPDQVIRTDSLASDLPVTPGTDTLPRAGALLVLGHSAPDLAADDGHAGPERPGPAPAAHRQDSASVRPSGRVLMICGTHSSAGKTFLVTAFARYFANQGLRVAPFKGQNMSNNARVVAGGEIGVAQYIQALAARQVPDVRMNPVLIKPQRRGSHVMMLGQYDPELSRLPWRLRKPPSWPVVRGALRELRDEYDLVIVEGAGSPAEPGQYHNDIVNMRVAREASAPVLLATEGARGGGIAHCYGSWQLVPEPDRALIAGFIINRFFADGYVAMLRTGRDLLERLTSVPTLGVIPELPYKLPEEDSHNLTPGGAAYRATPRDHSGGSQRVAVIAYPYMSNFDEFNPVAATSSAELAWIYEPSDLAEGDLVVLPGTKDVAASASWLAQTGLDEAVRAHAKAGQRVLAVCGGLQLVGKRFTDLAGVEESGTGIGLLDLETRFEADKIQRHASFTFGRIDGAWECLSKLTVRGYEIRHGRTESVAGLEVLPDGIGFASGSVLAIYFHGLFENAAALESILGVGQGEQAELDATFDAIAQALATYLDMDRIERIVFG